MDVIKIWLDQKRESLQCDFLGIALAGEAPGGGREIRWHYVSGNLNEAYRHIRLQKGRGIAGMVWKTGRVQKDEDIHLKREIIMEYPIARLEQLDGMLAVPIIVADQVTGVFAMGYRQTHRFTQEEEIQLAGAVPELTTLLEREGSGWQE